MKKPVRLLTGAVAALALVLTGCSGGGEETAPAPEEGSQPEELTTLSVMTMGLTFDGALFGGIEQGFFEDEGLEIETSVMAGPPAGLAAAQSGQVDIAYAPSIPILVALSEGVDVQFVASANGFPEDAINAENPDEFEDTGLFVAPGSGIESLEDLRGKTIAVPARKAVMEIVTAMELEDAGVGMDEVEWVVLDLASAVAALDQGTIDAAGLVSPFTGQARDIGAPKLTTPTVSFFEGGATSFWLAGSSTIAEKPELIQAFQRAIAKSNAWANENPDEAKQIGIDETDSPLSVDEVGTPVWNVDLNPEDVVRANEKLAQGGFIPAEVDLDGVIYTG